MPFLTGFSKRKEIKYGAEIPGENLTGFPKLFVISGDSDIAAELAGGGGIAVTEADETTEVPFGLYPSSDPASGDLILRAKFDLLTAASVGDTIGWLYYDSAETTVEDKAGTVDNGYVLFMPLEEDPSGSAPQMLDWVSETNVGTSAGSMTSGDLVAGQVGSGIEFDGTNDGITSSSFTALTTSATVECILKASAAADFAIPVTLNGFPWSQGSRTGGANTGISIYANSVSKTANLTGVYDDTFHQIAGTYDGSNLRAYMDGTLQDTEPATGDLTFFGTLPTTLQLGRLNGGNWFPGVVDEVRVSDVVRTADWLAYAYEDDFNNADTFTLGAEEEDGGGQTIALGQASETDSAFALAAKKTRALGQPSETDTAQPLAIRKTVVLGLVTESDLALAITLKKTRPLGRASQSRSPTSFANIPINGEFWANPENAAASDNVHATVTPVFSSGETDLLRATGYGFDIPDGATITGVQMQIERGFSFSFVGVVEDFLLHMVQGGAQVGSDAAENLAWPAAETVASFGGSGDLHDADLTPEIVNDPTYGFEIAGVMTGNVTAIRIDHMPLTVYYAAVPTELSIAFPLSPISKARALGLALQTETALGITVAGGVVEVPTFPGSVVVRRQGLSCTVERTGFTCQPKRAGLGSVTIERRTT